MNALVTAPEFSQSDVGPGLLGFIVVFSIAIALFFLVKSMNKQMAKIEVPYEKDLDK